MRINRLNEKIATLNEEMKRLKAVEKQRHAEPGSRLSAFWHSGRMIAFAPVHGDVDRGLSDA